MKLHTPIYGPVGAADRARWLRSNGLDGVFAFEGPHDVFTPLTLASSVPELDLMTNVAIAFPRNPVHLAHQANDLQLLSGGRFRLGLGTQIRPQIEKRFGVEFDHPVERMAELVAAIRAIFATWNDGTRLDFRGRFHRHTLMTPAFNPGPNPHGPPPILVGALGPRMTTMAAEVADGLLVMPFMTGRYFRERTMPRVEAGLAASGRTRDDFTVIPELIVACGRSDEEQTVADDGARALLAFYASTPAYRPVLDLHGWGDLQPELNAMSKAGAWAEMTALVDDGVLSTLAARGTPAQVADEVAERFGPDADELAFYLPSAVGDGVLRDLCEELRRRR